MTYKPEYVIGPESPGVWREVRRLEAEVERLRAALREIERNGDSQWAAAIAENALGRTK